MSAPPNSLPPNSLPPRRYAFARHSRRIRFLKLILPAVALAILSSLFLFSRSITLDGAIPFAEVDIEDRLREPKMTDVRIATTAANGAAIDLTATTVIPQGKRRAIANTATGKITALSGDVTTITAASLNYNDGAEKAALTGGVHIDSGGYVMTTQALDVDIASAAATSRSQVQATGPLGDLTAGRMSVQQTNGKFLLVFNSGVRLLYRP
jgi:lipopolysaccharide export system protein LptC